MRLILAVSAAVLLAPLAPMAHAAEGAPQRVTAVVQDAQGHLSFRSERVKGWTAASKRARSLRTAPGVVAASVDRRVHVTGTPDPYQGQQWGLSALSAETVWAHGDASGQVVAVIDTGVSAAHPDLAGVVRVGKDYVGTGDGRTDPNGHGTHVAGIIGAVGGNGIGIAGLAQGAEILPVRVMDADGSGYDGDAARGIVWAADHGATVANLSFGGPDRSSVMDSALSYALGKGVTIVAASGNEGGNGDPVLWPAADPGVIAVGAVDVFGNRPGWSSSGAHLAVAAPGVSILSTVPGGYSSWSGTSMAAPYVSAAAALLKHGTTLSPADVRTRFMSTATDLGAPGFDPLYGAGRIDPAAAEGLATALPVDTAPVTVPAPPPVVTEPAALPPAEPTTAPAAEPTSAPAAPVVEPTPAAEAPAPAVVAAPVLTARISASRTSVVYGGYVTLATRTLADGIAVGGVPVRLERRVGTSWVLTRTATTGLDGLASWSLRPDRTYDYRVVGAGFVPPTVRVAVTSVVSMSRYLTGRVLPGAATTVRLQQRRSTGWVTVGYATSTSTGAFRFTTRPATGSVVRAVAFGVGSPAVRL